MVAYCVTFKTHSCRLGPSSIGHAPNLQTNRHITKSATTDSCPTLLPTCCCTAKIHLLQLTHFTSLRLVTLDYLYAKTVNKVRLITTLTQSYNPNHCMLHRYIRCRFTCVNYEPTCTTGRPTTILQYLIPVCIIVTQHCMTWPYPLNTKSCISVSTHTGLQCRYPRVWLHVWV